MTFGYYNSRTPYEVQRDNGGIFDFAKIKERYENTKPIQSKQRKHLDVRPIGERDRSHERIIKVNENQYYLTFDAYRWSDIHQPDRTHTKAISFHLTGEMETVTVHTPLANWSAEKKLYPRALSSPSTYYFYDFNMPIGLTMHNHKSAKYVRVDGEEGYRYFTLEKGDITFTRKVGAKYWIPMVVHREVVHNLDRAKTKEWRATAKPLLEYLDVMVDMVEPKYLSYWENALACSTKDIPIDKVFKLVDGNAPEHWFTIAEHYKNRIEQTYYLYDHVLVNGKPEYCHTRKTEYDKSKLKAKLFKDLYKLVKPFKQIEVPLGTVCKDPYKSWF